MSRHIENRCFFFSSRRRHTRFDCDWSSDVCSSDLRQLINFARALAHDPRFLILDEATSSVDTKTELQIREALSRLLSGRTALVIAHRLSTKIGRASCRERV